jgi:hypothetical protein
MAGALDLDRRIDDNFDRLLDLLNPEENLSPEQLRQERLRALEQLLSASEERLTRERKEIEANRKWVGISKTESRLYAAERAARTLQKSARTVANLGHGYK